LSIPLTTLTAGIFHSSPLAWREYTEES
jgi:hypothetical protein